MSVKRVRRAVAPRSGSRPAQGFVPVRANNGQGRLLFRYDPVRNLVEVVKGKEKELIDLNKYRHVRVVRRRGAR